MFGFTDYSFACFFFETDYIGLWSLKKYIKLVLLQTYT